MEPKETMTVHDIQTVTTYLRVLQSIVLKEKMQKDIIKQINLEKARISEVVNILKRAGLIEISNLTKKYYVPVNFLVREFAEQMRVFKEKEIVNLIDLVNSCKKSIAKSRIPDIEEFLNLSNEKHEREEMTLANKYSLKNLRDSPPLLFQFLIMRSEAVRDLYKNNKIFSRFLNGLWVLSWEGAFRAIYELMADIYHLTMENFDEEFGSICKFVLSVDSKQKKKKLLTVFTDMMQNTKENK